MNIQESYRKAKQKAEENMTNGGISLDPVRFILLFNSEQNKLCDYYYLKRNSDEVKKIQKILVYNKEVERVSSDDISTLFRNPKDFFRFVAVRGEFKEGKCSVSDFELWDAKNENTNILYNDFNNEPSFDFRETFYTNGENGTRVYKKGFEVTKLFYDYYRYPVQVDMKQVRHADGSQGTDVDCEFDDRFVDEIIDNVVKAFKLADGNYNDYAAQKDNVNSPK